MITGEAAKAENSGAGAWERAPLSSRYVIKYGKANPGRPGRVPVVGSSGVYASTAEPLVRNPTVVIGRKGTAGQAWLIDEPSFPSDTTFYLESLDPTAVDIAFTYFALRYFQISASDDVIPSLQRQELESLELPFPPIAEQRAIARVLSKIQAALNVQDRIIGTVKQLKAATMAKLFREGLRGGPLKQTEIGEIPSEWAVRPLGSVAKVSTGTTPATDRSEYYAGLIPFVKTAEIDDSTITDCRQHISEGAVDRYRLRVYPPGTIFLAMYGQGKTRGRAAFLAIAAATSQNTAAIEPGEELDSHFIWQYLLGQYEALRNLGNLGHLSHLNLGYVKSLPVPVPPKDEQIAIRDQLSILHRSLEAQQRCRGTLLVLFSSMLHLLMTGQVRVTRRMIALQALADRVAQRPKWSGKMDEKVLEEVVRRIVEAVAPEKIILFGSAARGEMGPDSDLDLLVVKSCENRREVAQAIYRSLRGTGGPKDVVVVTPEDIEEQKDIPGMVVRAALREGKVVYAA